MPCAKALGSGGRRPELKTGSGLLFLCVYWDGYEAHLLMVAPKKELLVFVIFGMIVVGTFEIAKRGYV